MRRLHMQPTGAVQLSCAFSIAESCKDRQQEKFVKLWKRTKNDWLTVGAERDVHLFGSIPTYSGIAQIKDLHLHAPACLGETPSWQDKPKARVLSVGISLGKKFKEEIFPTKVFSSTSSPPPALRPPSQTPPPPTPQRLMWPWPWRRWDIDQIQKSVLETF